MNDVDILAQTHGTFKGSDLFYAFYKIYNGGNANKDCIASDMLVRLHYFFYIKKPFMPPASTIVSRKQWLDSDPWTEKFFKNTVVFSQDEGGNPIYIDKITGEVFYTPTDVIETYDDFERYLLADSFDSFLKNLEYPSIIASREDLPNVEFYKNYEKWWDEQE